MRSSLRIALVGLAAASALIGAAAAFWLGTCFFGSLPQEAGRIETAGLAAPARIVRDPHGVPHIFAARAADAYFALGYAHAQDRFFQMDLTRRAVEGRLAELVGQAALGLDAQARIKNFAAVIAAQTAGLSPPARAMLAAYAAGVNARLARGAPSPEYGLLFLKPAPWRVEDSVAVGLAMTDNLSVGAERDLARAELASRLSPAQIGQFFPPYPAWAARSYGPPAPEARTPDRPAPGSNAWALAGARTATGKPILANDPHLAFAAPGPFYLVHLKLPSGDLVGATLPGAPLVAIGRNGDLAWTNTTDEIDSVDLLPAPKGGFANVRTRTERIVVRDWFWAKHVRAIAARETPIGPLLEAPYFHLDAFQGRPIALRSAALDRGNRVIDALRLMNGARSVDAFAAAASGWTAPMTHMLVGARDDQIALISTGAPPLRDGSGAWIGVLPRAARPPVKTPQAGVLVTANNLAAPAPSAYPMPGAYAPYRVTRIRALLDSGAGRDVAGAMRMQADTHSLFAARVLPELLAGAAPQTAQARRARALLARWDADMAAGRPEPLIFAAWIDAFSRRLYRDELGAALFARYAGPRRAFLDSVLTGPNAAWCDDVRTPRKESCADLAGAALDEAMAALATRYGPDPARWRWGRAHPARFAHPLFEGIPALGALFAVSVPIGGAGDTIFANDYRAGDYAAVHGPSLRAVFDLADLNRSRFVIAPGQSGHPLSPHFRDLIADWAAGRGFEIRTDIDPRRPPAGYKTLTLTPPQL